MAEPQNITRGASKVAGAGNGVFAAKAFAPGDAIISLPRPMIAELDTAHLDDACAWCFTQASEAPPGSGQGSMPGDSIELKACSICKQIKYCSKSCQTKGWRADHKHECKALVNRPPLPHGVRATIKLLKRYSSGDEAVGEILSLQPKVDGLKQHNPELLKDCRLMAQGAWELAGRPKNTTTELAETILLNVMCNMLDLTSNPALGCEPLGFGFDPLVCSINHSCEPNAQFVFNNPKLMIRATKPIAKGDEVFIQYRDGSNPYLVRQKQLQEKYFFTCKCQKCQKGSASREDAFAKPIEELSPDWCREADDIARALHIQKTDFSRYHVGDTLAERRMTALQAFVFSQSGQHGPDVENPEIALRKCIESEMWPMTRQPVPYLLRTMFDTARFAETNAGCEKALNIGLIRYFTVFPTLNPQPFDLERIADVVFMVQLAMTITMPSDSTSRAKFMDKGVDLKLLTYGLLSEAWEALPLSYGRDSQFGQVVTEIWSNVLRLNDRLPMELEARVKQGWPKIKSYAEGLNVLDYI